MEFIEFKNNGRKFKILNFLKLRRKSLNTGNWKTIKDLKFKNMNLRQGLCAKISAFGNPRQHDIDKILLNISMLQNKYKYFVKN